MLANLQAGYDAVSAFERTNAAVDTVLLRTWQADAYELQLIAAQEAFAAPDQGAGRTAGLIFPSGPSLGVDDPRSAWPLITLPHFSLG